MVYLIHTYMHTNKHIYSTCMHSYIHAYIQTYTVLYTHLWSLEKINDAIHTYIHTYIQRMHKIFCLTKEAGSATCSASDIGALVVDGVAGERVGMSVQVDAEILHIHTYIHTYKYYEIHALIIGLPSTYTISLCMDIYLHT